MYAGTNQIAARDIVHCTLKQNGTFINRTHNETDPSSLNPSWSQGHLSTTELEENT